MRQQGRKERGGKRSDFRPPRHERREQGKMDRKGERNEQVKPSKPGEKGGRISDDLCWGRNPVLTLLEETPSRCLKVVVSKTMQKGVFDRLTRLCREAGIPFSLSDPRALDAMTAGENHQGVVVVASQTELMTLEEAAALLPQQPEPALAVLFDHIQDPHNLGAMIRSAEAAGASFAALPLRRSSLPTGTVVKTSAGASLRFPLASVGNTAAAVGTLQDEGLWTIGLDAEAKTTIYDAPIPVRSLFVVGAEGKGLTRTVASACDETMSIPIGGGVGSLNASIALAIAMFEWARVNRRNG